MALVVWLRVDALKFNANGKVVAAGAASETGLPGVPCALGEWYELFDTAVTANKQVRRNFHSANFVEIGVRIPIQSIVEQGFHIVAAEIARRQTDAVQYDHVDAASVRPRVAIGAQRRVGPRQQTTFRIDSKFASHDVFRHDFSIMSTRLFVSGTLINGAERTLDGDAARYLGKVLRARIGDTVTLFNGDGSDVECRILSITKSTVSVCIGDRIQRDAESPLRIHLVQGVSRGDRMDWVVQKATELGVKRITPILTEFGVVKLDADRAEKRREHWQKVATSACEQSGRTRLPLIDIPVPLRTWLGQKTDAADVDLVLHPGASQPLSAVAPPTTKVCLLVGPEGGFSDDEYNVVAASGFVDVALGPRILRTETAALAAVAVLQSLWGDLGTPH